MFAIFVILKNDQGMVLMVFTMEREREISLFASHLPPVETHR